MKSFLYRIARLFLTNESANIANYTFVFPNRRAGLFFRKHLTDLADSTFFSPEIITINDCFSELSPLYKAERLECQFRLFRLYKKLSKTDETFDSFVFWGDILLNDFNEVDRYLVDVKQLFQNITDLNEIDNIFDSLSETQLEAIREFWNKFFPATDDDIKSVHISTWNILYELYTSFTQDLITDGIGTDGMIGRSAVDLLKKPGGLDVWKDKKFVFVGFNALNPCERALMLELKQQGNADFYWDYDSGFLRDTENPASMFCSDNMKLFPSNYYLKPEPEDLKAKVINMVGVPSAVGMTKYVCEVLEEIGKDENSWMKTAVVMPDEKLLVPMLYSFPPEIDKVNITMGYPIQTTPVAGFVMQLFELQRRCRVTATSHQFYHKNVTDILHHQLVSQLFPKVTDSILQNMTRMNRIYVDSSVFKENELLSRIFSVPNDSPVAVLSYLSDILLLMITEWKNHADTENNYSLERDYMLKYRMLLTQLKTVFEIKGADIQLNIDTLGRLIQQLVVGESIPFIGEPLDGLQVMGVLESRGLDFDRLIITSFNEGVFPAARSQNSFIPHVLRRGFGLPTYELYDAITSYNFYRLIQHASELHLVYDVRNDGAQTGEISRYALQLKYLYNCKLTPIQYNYNIVFNEPGKIRVEKTKLIQEKLKLYFDDGDSKSSLSASSINAYINCPLQFYLSKVEKLNEKEEIKENVEDNVFGSIFHKAIELLYEPYVGKMVTESMIVDLIKDEMVIQKAIALAFASEYFKTKNELQPIEGRNLIIAKVIRKYILRLFQFDKSNTPFLLYSNEKVCGKKLSTRFGEVNIKGIIDRIDEKDGVFRVIDYKTGRDTLEFYEMADLFEHDKDKRPSYVMQTFLYGLLFKQYANEKPISPGIIYLRNLFNDDFNTAIYDKRNKQHVMDFAVYENQFTEELTKCVESIFDPEIAFVQTENVKKCEYCNYREMCNR